MDSAPECWPAALHSSGGRAGIFLVPTLSMWPPQLAGPQPLEPRGLEGGHPTSPQSLSDSPSIRSPPHPLVVAWARPGCPHAGQRRPGGCSWRGHGDPSWLPHHAQPASPSRKQQFHPILKVGEPSPSHFGSLRRPGTLDARSRVGGVQGMELGPLAPKGTLTQLEPQTVGHWLCFAPHAPAKGSLPPRGWSRACDNPLSAEQP